MTRDLKFMIAITAVVAVHSAAAHLVVGQEKTTAIPASNSSSSGASASGASDSTQPKNANLDLNKMLEFAVEPNKEGGAEISFTGLKTETVKIADAEAPLISQLIEKEFNQKEVPSGVIIRVDKSLKYPTKLYNSVKKSLADSNIKSEVYISLKKPRSAQATKQEEKVSQEYVLKKAKASVVYDLIGPVLKKKGVEMRLDPTRNSITANGPASRIKWFVDAMRVLDERSGANTTVVDGANPKSGSGTIPADSSPARANPDASSRPTPRVGANIDPRQSDNIAPANTNPSIQRPMAGNSRADNSRPQNSPQGSVNGKAIGRYQLSAVGQTVIMLDTSTGQSWFLDSSAQDSMLWIPIPVPNGVGN